MKNIIMTAAVVAALGASAITEDEIEKLIGGMTLDEKIGQMVQAAKVEYFNEKTGEKK